MQGNHIHTHTCTHTHTHSFSSVNHLSLNTSSHLKMQRNHIHTYIHIYIYIHTQFLFGKSFVAKYIKPPQDAEKKSLDLEGKDKKRLLREGATWMHKAKTGLKSVIQ
jgi:hypothetical protein